MFLFYVPALTQGEIVLPEEEAHHLRNVLRLGPGDKVMVTDGRGLRCESTVTSVTRQSVILSSESCILLPVPADKLHLVVAPTKNADRFEWMVEKATEAGVYSITPLLCRRSERKSINTGRLSKLMVAAAKQSERYRFPVINAPVDFDTFISSPRTGAGFIAHCGEGTKADPSQLMAQGECHVLIGPEGDFTDSELSAAASNGFQSLSLGKYRLRTETAALFAVIAFQVNSFRYGK